VTQPASGRPRQHKHKSRPRPGTADVTPDAAGLASRQAAAKLLAAVVDAGTPLDGMTDAHHGHPQYRALDERDRALVRAILNSALRRRGSIEAILAARIDRPLPANARTLAHVLHVALAQILFLDIPDSAAVDLAVEHAKADPRTARFAGLVNAVLRGVARDKQAALDAVAGARNAPDWFVRRLEAAYGKHEAETILAAYLLEPTIDFTVKSDEPEWAERFGGVVLPSGSVRVERLDGPVTALPGFEDGQWWVQDAAAALPARLMGDIAGKKVADLCAAPGGKTAQLSLAGADVTAFDISANRLKRLEQNLARLGLPARTAVGDIAKYEGEALFDAVLLDAPCSSTGTVRRHPDVLWTKSEADIVKLAGVQRALLDEALRLTRPGGTIVFSNCSLDPLEGEELVTAFLAQTPNVALDPIGADEIAGIGEFVTPEGYLRTTPAGLAMATPELSGLDGFFAARFVKRGG
jgi:16S rRNA (cytosine967-C5)-methyltransferase